MPLAQQTQYQANRYSFTDIAIDCTVGANFGGQLYSFPKGVVQSLSWDASQDAAWVQGNRVTPMGRTTGMGTCTGSIELLVSESDDWLSNISSNGVYPPLSVYFDLRVTYSVNGTDVRIDTLQGSRIIKVGAANQKGSDATTKSFDLMIALPIQNGIPLYADPST